MKLEDFESIHKEKILRLISEFNKNGNIRIPEESIIIRYFHEMHNCEEANNLNGSVPSIVYIRTKRRLIAEY